MGRCRPFKSPCFEISNFRALELCESRGGRPGLSVPNKPTVSVDVKQHSTKFQSAVCACKGQAEGS